MKNTLNTPDGTSFLFSSLPYKVRKQIKEDKKDYSLKNKFSLVLDNLPEEVKIQYLKEKKIQKTYNQFEAVTDRVILDHVNSVYLLKENNRNNLVVYVDNSLIAAELNARRELIKFKYRDQFGIEIDSFEIRISRGPYLNNYPFRNTNSSKDNNLEEKKELSMEEITSINEMVSHIEDSELRESFKKVLIAQKQHKDKFLEK